MSMEKLSIQPIFPTATVFIDGANMYFAQKKMGWEIDWVKILQYLKERYTVLETRYYSGLKQGDEEMQKYLNKLEKLDFIIISKPLKKICIGGNKDKPHSSQAYIYKANFDVEITADLILQKDSYDSAILFSGDSDFEYVVNKLKQFDKKVVVFCAESGLSRELKKAANQVSLLGNIRAEIEYSKKKTSARKPRIT